MILQVADSCTVDDAHIVTDIEELWEASFSWPSATGPPLAVCKGDSVKRQTLSPSPTQPRRKVTFKQSSLWRDTEVNQFHPSTSGDRQSLKADDSWLLSWTEEPEGLGCSPELDPQVQEFLSGEGVPYAGNNDDSDWSSTLEPPFKDSNKWVLWYACQVEMLAWWPKLQRVPNQKEPFNSPDR